MDRFEQELRDALRRKQAPGNLSARVLMRVEAEKSSRRHGWFGLRAREWAAVAALVIVLAATGAKLERRHEERVAGEEARRQVVLALHIAGSKLQLAETKVQQLSENP